MSQSHQHHTDSAVSDATGHHSGSSAASGVVSYHDLHLGRYYFIGGSLLFLTVVTVGLSYVDFGSPSSNIWVAMALATFKVCLVGAVFMHLKGEKRTIWRFLIFTAIFGTGLFLLTLLAWSDMIFGSSHNHY
jgi:caa(3)-type oxidase subunit IV